MGAGQTPAQDCANRPNRVLPKEKEGRTGAPIQRRQRNSRRRRRGEHFPAARLRGSSICACPWSSSRTSVSFSSRLEHTTRGGGNRTRTCACTCKARPAVYGMRRRARSAVVRAGKLMDLRERFRSRLEEHAKAIPLLDRLFQNPYVTVARARRLLKTTNCTARQAVKRLVDAGMLEETTGRSCGQIFWARPILRTIHGSPPRGGQSNPREAASCS